MGDGVVMMMSRVWENTTYFGSGTTKNTTMHVPDAHLSSNWLFALHGCISFQVSSELTLFVTFTTDKRSYLLVVPGVFILGNRSQKYDRRTFPKPNDERQSRLSFINGAEQHVVLVLALLQ